MPSNADTVPNVAKDWEFRQHGSPRRPGSKVYPWTASGPGDAWLFVLLFACAVAAAFAVWMIAIWILHVLGRS